MEFRNLEIRYSTIKVCFPFQFSNIDFRWSEDIFPRGCDENRFQFFDRSLSGRVKPTDGLDLIAKEIQADRQLFGGCPYIQDATAPGELTGFQHSIDTLITS